MRKIIILILASLSCFALAESKNVMQQRQQSLSPQQVLQRLKAGNHAFMEGKVVLGNLALMKHGAKKGQFPLSIVLSCVDSRSIPEVTLNQKKGDMFVARVAGNVVNTDMLGSMEFATAHAGTKLILVMGHTSCGAVAAACGMEKHTFSKNLTSLLKSIRPAVKAAKKIEPMGQCTDPQFINLIAKENVLFQIKKILKKSPLIRHLVKEKKVLILGGLHNIKTGKVTFFDKI